MEWHEWNERHEWNEWSEWSEWQEKQDRRASNVRTGREAARNGQSRQLGGWRME